MGEFEDPESRIKRAMREAVPDTSNVADFAAAARKRGRPVAKAATVLNISGSNNAGIVGNHNQVNITVRAPSRPKITVTPGPGTITQAQAAELQELVAKVVTSSGKTHQLVWGVLKKKYRYASYHMLPEAQFDEVRAYLRSWIASIAGPGDPTPAAARKRALNRIHAEEKKVPGMRAQVRAYIHGRFGTETLADLTQGQLVEVIRQFRF